MTLFQCMLFYAVSWWLVLFMVLPVGTRPAAEPGRGHAASAPANPRLKRKLLITSLITLLVTLLVYGANEARAESGMYHAGSGASALNDSMYRAESNDCVSADLAPTADVNLPDTATMDGGMPASGFENVPTYLDAPASDYSDNAQLGNKLYGGGVVNVGVASTNTKTGEVTLNGQKIGGNQRPAHCQ